MSLHERIATVLSVAPAGLPITLAEAKSHLRETTTDNDTLITNLITAATEEAENYTWRRFVTQTWTFYNHSFFNLKIPFGQLQSVTSVKYYDADNVLQTLATSIYDVNSFSDPGSITLSDGQNWPTIFDRPNPIEVLYVCGYTSVPEAIKHAIKLLVESMFANLFENEFNQVNAAYERILRPYRIVEF